MNKHIFKYIKSYEYFLNDIATRKMSDKYSNTLESHVDLISENCGLPFGDFYNPSGCLPFGGLDFIPAKVRNIANVVSKYVSFQGYTPYETTIEFRLQKKCLNIIKFRWKKSY